MHLWAEVEGASLQHLIWRRQYLFVSIHAERGS